MKLCIKCGASDRYKSGACRPCSIKYRTSNPEKKKSSAAKWRAANPEKAKAATTKWRAANKKKLKADSAKYYTENTEKKKSGVAKWRRENPEACCILNQNRRARKRANGGKLSSGLAKVLYAKQGGKCACCKKPLGDKYHLDHIMPLILGGANEDWNIQLLRASCNSRKGGKHPVDYMRERGLLI